MTKNSNQILRALIREVIREDVGDVTVSRGPRKKSIGSRVASWFGFGDADESNVDEEILDELDEKKQDPGSCYVAGCDQVMESESEDSELDEECDDK